jgi:hypothetical protein
VIVTTRLVVVADDMSRDERDAVTTALREFGKADNGFFWWHRFPTLWLLVDSASRTASWWRNYLKEFAGSGGYLVFSVGAKSAWAGVVTKEQMKWLHGPWNANESK